MELPLWVKPWMFYAAIGLAFAVVIFVARRRTPDGK